MKPVLPPEGERDLGYERQKLTQRLNERAQFDPEGFAELGTLCYEMRDLFHAGRLWLFSSAEGEHVEQAIDYFAERCHRKPRTLVSQVPKYQLLDDPARYPDVIRPRLSRLGISAEDILERIRPASESPGPGSVWIPAAILIYLVGCLALGIAGSVWLLYRLVAWLVG